MDENTIQSIYSGLNSSPETSPNSELDVKKIPAICGTCGRKDTDPLHPSIGDPVVCCEYPYGYHDLGETKWLNKRKLQNLIVHYSLAEMMAKERLKMIGRSCPNL